MGGFGGGFSGAHGIGGFEYIPPVDRPTFKLPVSYYLNLFTSQYKLSTKLQAWQAALVQPIDDLTTCMAGFVDDYNLNEGVGNQLDVLGQIIGVSRTVPFQPSDGVSPILDDTTYLLLLRATQAKNNWDGKTVSLYPIWQRLFPGGSLVVHDNQDMTATIIIGGGFTSIESDLITNGLIVPRPEGVLYNYVFATLPIFGFDLNNSEIAGFDVGHFV